MPSNITFGQIRQGLKAASLPFTIDSAMQDGKTVPEHSLGGRPDGLIEAQLAPRLDLAQVIDVPTTNPILAQRRAALKFQVLGSIKTMQANVPAPQGSSGPAGRAASVDWRNRGWPVLCTVQSQVGENCWAMTATALVETMARINHSVWAKRSEGDVHDGLGAKIGDGGNVNAALDWIKTNGQVDLDSYPSQATLPYKPAPDRSGRTVKIDGYTAIGDIEQQKTWIDTVGPLATWFDVWHDFDAFYGTPDNAVYRWRAELSPGVPNYERGGHFMLVVGYDDASQSWICRNSWGPNFGHGGYIRVGYGDQKSGIDKYAKIGLQVTNVDPWTKRRLHNGAMIESGNGALHRNFELVARGAPNTIVQWWRDGSELSWHKASTLANDAASFPCLTGTTYNRNFEFIYQTAGGRLHHWFFDQGAKQWRDGGVFGPTDAAGTPGLLQSNFGSPGNFEVVVRTRDGRLAHWWRTNGPPWTWTESARFAEGIALSGPTLVQSHYPKPGNLEFVAVRNDGAMQHFYRDDIGKTGWHSGVTFGSGISSTPVMIEGQYGAANENAVGNFELCVAKGGQIEHWWRNNQGGGAWARSAVFGQNVRNVIALVEGSYGFNLEIVAERNDGQLQHFWRDGAGWHPGVVIGPTV